MRLKGVFLALAFFASGNIHAESRVARSFEGGALYVMRSGLTEHLAEFRHGQDCALIAKTLNSLEGHRRNPGLLWTCSTSTPEERFTPVGGGALYLNRNDFETFRAEFRDQPFCKMVAEVMSHTEPAVNWYCSTSTNPKEFSCKIENVRVVDTDAGHAHYRNFYFAMSVNRGKAITSIHMAAYTFDVFERGNVLVLENDYEYRDGNFLSRAIYKMRLDIRSGELRVSDHRNALNGAGRCRQTK